MRPVCNTESLWQLAGWVLKKNEISMSIPPKVKLCALSIPLKVKLCGIWWKYCHFMQCNTADPALMYIEIHVMSL